MRVLVTGASGFIGSWVVDALCGDGHDVLGVDVRAPREGAPGTHVRQDLRDTVFPAGSGFDAAIHLAAFGGVSFAAKHPRQIFESNVDATIQLVDQLRRMPGLRRVIHASSFSVYGDAKTPTDEASALAPKETYAASKAAQELAFVGSGLPVSILRFSSVYGQRMAIADPEATILAKLAGWISRGEKLTINEDGYQSRDFVHVSDIVTAIRVLLSYSPPSGLVPEHRKVINVCSGQPTTLRRAIEVISHVVGKPADVEYTGKARPGDMRHCLGDATRLRGLIGREPLSFSLGAIDAFAGLA